MPSQVILRQPVEFRLGGDNCLPALLDVAAELQRRHGGLLVQRLDPIARLLVLIDAGKPIAQQRALHKVKSRRARARQVHGHKRVVHPAIQAQCA